jgi:hypothetical protein
VLSRSVFRLRLRLRLRLSGGWLPVWNIRELLLATTRGFGF